MADLHPDIVRAIRGLENTRLGRRYDRFARRRYGVPGWKLAGKTVSGEFGGRSTAAGRGVVSSAGARGPAQFIPGTRQTFIRKYGIDPWKNDKSAIRALEKYQLQVGVEGYNPGDPNYKNYILGQKLNASDKNSLRRGGIGTPGTTGTPPSVSLQSRKIPGQSFAADREQAKVDLLLGGKLTLNRLLDYKRTINSLQDVPGQTISELSTKPGNRQSTVATRGSRGTVAPQGGKVIGFPYQGTHSLGNWQSDNAIDIAMPTGSLIDVPKDAVVEKVKGSYRGGASRFDGFQVTVRLSDGNRLFYTHLSKANVRAGQRLRAGRVIGRSGAANGVQHLHLGAEHGNPRKYYKR